MAEWEQLSETCWARKGVGFVFVPEGENDVWVGKHIEHPAKVFDTVQEAMIYVDSLNDCFTTD